MFDILKNKKENTPPTPPFLDASVPPPPPPSSPREYASESWMQESLEKTLLASITENRRARRWNIFFRLFRFGVILLIVAMFASASSDNTAKSETRPHTAIVQISGVIASDTEANADDIIAGLHDAIENQATEGIILHIDSPGGSPVQSARIFDEIRRIRETHSNLPIIAVAEDTCASGAYYVASAADKIFAHPSSIIGSIGVRSDGFGFTGLLEKLGIERRSYTSGENKSFLDAYLPVEEKDISHLQGILDEMHRQFINSVKKGRGGRLAENPDIFSGLFWTGVKAKELGLIDGFGDVGSASREIGAEYTVDYTRKRSFWDELASASQKQVVSFIQGMAEQGQIPKFW